MRCLLTLIAALTLAGCDSGTQRVTIDGWVTESANIRAPLPNATVSILDEEGTPFAESLANDIGKFSVDAPAGRPAYLLVDAPDHVTASFGGTIGMSDQSFDEGLFFGVHRDELADWRGRFAGCPAVAPGAATGTVIGDVRLYLVTDRFTKENPLVTTGFAKLLDTDGEQVATACYLDAESGVAYDADATRTGTAGQFYFEGVPSGQYRLEVGYNFVPGQSYVSKFDIWVLPGGVAPMLPAFVDLFL